MRRVDLNCDLGEGAGHDAELMPLVTSANIACGAHAGDDATMRATIELASAHGVAVGAHPGFADPENFGRRELAIPPVAAGELVFRQVQRLQQIAYDLGTHVSHIKLHGALYNLAARDFALAEAIVAAIWVTDKHPVFFVPAGSVLEQVARANGDVRVVAEVFADRTYQADGSLTPRSRPDALVSGPEEAVAQVLRMLRDGRVRATDGTDVAIRAETICVHGDGPQAVAFAQRLRRDLAAAGFSLKAASA